MRSVGADQTALQAAHDTCAVTLVNSHSVLIYTTSDILLM